MFLFVGNRKCNHCYKKRRFKKYLQSVQTKWLEMKYYILVQHFNICHTTLHFIYMGPCIVNRYLMIVQQDATYSVYYISVGSSTCFGCWHPSSGARTTVIRLLVLINRIYYHPLSLLSWKNYGCTSSWWWVSTTETCRDAYRNVINWIQSHFVGQLLNNNATCLCS